MTIPIKDRTERSVSSQAAVICRALRYSRPLLQSGAGQDSQHSTHIPISFPHHQPCTGATLFDRKDDLSDFIDDKDVIAIGPGLGVNEDTRRTTEYLIEHFEGPLVIDADGLSELQK